MRPRRHEDRPGDRVDDRGDDRTADQTDEHADSQSGAAIVDFVLVASLLTLVFVAVVQFTVVVHVRNTLVDCAGEGARYAALAGNDDSAGVQRARELISGDLSPAYAGDVTAGRESFAGLQTVVVRVRAPLPLIGLLGAGRVITVEGHAVAERP